jgi:hypothetical protein
MSTKGKGGTYAVVLGDVAVERADENHGDHEGQEQDDQDGVHDTEPVHLREEKSVEQNTGSG